MINILPKYFIKNNNYYNTCDIIMRYNIIIIYCISLKCNYCINFDKDIIYYYNKWFNLYNICLLYILIDNDDYIIKLFLNNKKNYYVSIKINENNIFLDKLNINSIPYIIVLNNNGDIIDHNPIDNIKKYGINYIKYINGEINY